MLISAMSGVVTQIKELNISCIMYSVCCTTPAQGLVCKWLNKIKNNTHICWFHDSKFFIVFDLYANYPVDPGHVRAQTNHL